jgi:beta-glucosidase
MRGVAVGGRPADLGDLVGSAAAAAGDADVAVVVVGTNDEWETEGEDRQSIGLPGRQDELIRAVLAANPNTVVVVNAGSPVSMPWADDVPAILQVWFPGGQFGAALTDVLAGDVEPGGRLPVTFPRRLEDTPAYPYYPGDGVRAEYGEGLRIGHRHYDAAGVAPLFPFGHGLGYTTFAIDAADVTGDPRSGVVVAADVSNTGDRPGSEVVQVYSRYIGAHQDVEPLLRFAGSRKITLDPGERTRVRIELGERSFASWLDGGWVVPPGDHRLLVGRSSASLVDAGVVEA